MKRFLFTIALLPLVNLPSVAGEIHVTIERGNVLLNQGEGYAPVTSSAPVAPGNRILVRPSGSAIINYGSNCSVRIGAHSVWTITHKVPCRPGQRTVDMQIGRMHQQAAPPATLGTTGMIAIGAAAAGIGWGIYSTTKGHDDITQPPPASP